MLSCTYDKGHRAQEVTFGSHRLVGFCEFCFQRKKACEVRQSKFWQSSSPRLNLSDVDRFRFVFPSVFFS